MKLVAVVPAFNDGPTITEVVSSLRQAADSVIVVDDGSVDRTAELAKTAGATVIRHHLNRGQGAALRTGTEFALKIGAGIIVHIDADGQHDPKCITELVSPLTSGQADVVLGSRFLGSEPVGMPFSRRLLLSCARLFNRLILGIPLSITDPQSGLRAMTAEVALKLDFRQDRMAHCSEILHLVTRGGWRVVEVPVKVYYSDRTLTKGQKAIDALRIAWQLLIGLFQK